MIRNYFLYNTTGNYNTAVGNRSLQSNTFGKYNNAFGQTALLSNNFFVFILLMLQYHYIGILYLLMM